MKNTIFMFVTFCTSLAFAAEFKVAIVDMQKAIQTSSAGKKAKKEVEGDFEKKKKELKKKEDDLKKRVEEFEKKQAVLSDKVRQEQQAELQKDMMQFREEVGKSQMTIQQRERELTKPILEKLQKIISEIAKEKDFSVVLEKAEQSVMFAKSELDITDEVIKRADK
jgi:outer membrane protein